MVQHTNQYIPSNQPNYSCKWCIHWSSLLGWSTLK